MYQNGCFQYLLIRNCSKIISAVLEIVYGFALAPDSLDSRMFEEDKHYFDEI